MRDGDVRSALIARLNAQHADDPDTRIVEEMGVWSGHVRIDVAVINGELCGFELKSDRDTLARLPNQAQIYSRVFDRVELVVGTRHREEAVKLVPKWWGVTTAKKVEHGVELSPVRIAKRNPGPDPYLIAQLLWKGESLDLLAKFGLAIGWKSKRIKHIHLRLAECLPLDELRNGVRAALKSRVGKSGEIVPDLLDMPVH
ncbi:MAG: sce7726 family protein [Mesorhizobium sp.]